tara:strand:+ start:346 stop:543 length:198 start_codon:yes stop_codon:yes gene_type:complete
MRFVLNKNEYYKELLDELGLDSKTTQVELIWYLLNLIRNSKATKKEFLLDRIAKMPTVLMFKWTK